MRKFTFLLTIFLLVIISLLINFRFNRSFTSLAFGQTNNSGVTAAVTTNAVATASTTTAPAASAAAGAIPNIPQTPVPTYFSYPPLASYISPEAEKREKEKHDDARMRELEKPCLDANINVKEKFANLSKSCGNYKLGIETCIEKIENCNACRNGDGKDCEDTEAFEEFMAKSIRADFGQSAKPPTNKSSRLQDDLKNYEMCPILLAEQLDELKKENEDLEKEKKEDSEKEETLKEELGKIEAEIKQTQEDYQAEMIKINGEQEEAMDEIKESAKEATENLRKQYDDTGAAIDRAIESLDNEALLQEEAIKAAELECYNMSINQLNQFLKARKEAVAAGQLTTNGFKSLIGSTGKTRKQKNAQFAQERYISCLEDKNFKTKKDSIKKRYNLMVERIRNEINSLHKKQGQLVLDMGGEKMREKYETAIKKANRKAETDMSTATKKFNAERTKLLAQMQAKQSQLSKLNYQIQERAMELDAYGHVLGFATKNKIHATKNKNASDLDSAKADYLFAVEHAFASCGCGKTNDDDKREYNNTKNSLNIANICKSLQKIDPDDDNSMMSSKKRGDRTGKSK